MELALIRSLMDKEFYDNHRGSRCPERLFSPDVRKIKKAIDSFAQFHDRAGRVGVEGNREYNAGWHTALDLRNLLTVAEAVARSAILRKESRGAHFREDHLEKDPEQGKLNTVVRQGADGEMQVIQEPLSPIREDLRQIIEDNK